MLIPFQLTTRAKVAIVELLAETAANATKEGRFSLLDIASANDYLEVAQVT